MKKADRIISFDWDKYDQANVVYRPAQMSGDELRLGQIAAYETFYPPRLWCVASRCWGKRSRLQWSIYNLFMKKGAATDRKGAVAAATECRTWCRCRPSCPSSRSCPSGPRSDHRVGEPLHDGCSDRPSPGKAARSRARHAYRSAH